jgi:hypothetical protein
MSGGDIVLLMQLTGTPLLLYMFNVQRSSGSKKLRNSVKGNNIAMTKSTQAFKKRVKSTRVIMYF